MNTGRYNLKQLLTNSEVDQIIIPEIQRDYVWESTNVEKLLNTIFGNFCKKRQTNISIQDHGIEKEIEATLKEYLSEEYARLKFNTRVGFIYAYSDLDYPGRFFLIDGQQRITTLYLLLLALYVRAYPNKDNTNVGQEFSSLYFRDNRLKLDYKVREVSHDFLMAFVTYVLTNKGAHDFEKSDVYYNVYDDDKTCQSVMANFKVIESTLDKVFAEGNDKEAYIKAIDYVENYIEFNYFDTKLSEQGERLYLYMNSRGESLSQQEVVKSALIAKSDNKIKDGQKWEVWQDFFWRHRGENVNADLGFELFLKISTILHAYENLLSQEQRENTGGVSEGEVKMMENFIKRKSEVENQDRLLKKYQVSTNSFTIDWLNHVFEGISVLDKYGLLDVLHAPYFRSKWLSKETHTIDYVTICGSLCYIMKNPDAEKLNINRLGMYLKNICFYGENSSHPVATVIGALKIVSKLKGDPILGLDKMINLWSRLCAKSDRFKFECYLSSDSERPKWEKIFWRITNEKGSQEKDDNAYEGVNDYIEGDVIFLKNICEIDSVVTPENLEKYFDLFVTKIYNIEKRKSHTEQCQLRREMLEYGDVTYNDWGGSRGYQRNNILSLNSRANRRHMFEANNQIIHNFLLGENRSNIDLPDWLQCIMNPDYEILEYMSEFKFLRTSEKENIHLSILANHKATVWGYQDLQIHLFRVMWNKENKVKCYSWFHDLCYIEFTWEGDKLQLIDKTGDDYFFDIVYNPWDSNGSTWTLLIGKRDGGIPEDFVMNHWGKEADFNNKENYKLVFNNAPFYIDEANLRIEENVRCAIKAFKSIVDEFI